MKQRRTTETRLNSLSQLLFEGDTRGSSDDVLATQLVLAAHEISADASDNYPLAAALNETRNLVKINRSESGIVGGAVSTDGRRYVTAGLSGNLQVWDTETGLPSASPIQVSMLNAVDLSPDGSRAVTAGLDGWIRFWDTQTGEQIGKPIDSTLLNGVVLAPGGERVLSIGWDGYVRVWRSDSRELEREIHAVPGFQWLYSLAVSPDGRQIATGGADSVVRLWDPDTGDQVGEIAATEPVTAIAYSRDGRQIAYGDDRGTSRWPTQTQAHASEAPWTDMHRAWTASHSARTTAVSFRAAWMELFECGTSLQVVRSASSSVTRPR